MKNIIPLISIFIILFSCAPKKNMVYMSNHNYEQEVSEAKYKGLHIQEGDVLEITVNAFDAIAIKPFNKTSMSVSNQVSNVGSSVSSGSTSATDIYQVDAEGNIIYPVLGKIYCKGMTKQQLKENMESELLKYLKDPLVTIKLTNFNFSVLGEVGSSGQRTSSTEKLNIFQALALAGDIKPSGNKTNVKLIRSSENNSKDEIVTLNLTESNITSSPYYYLQQNDILYVEPDKNSQIEANNNSNVDKVVKYMGAGLGLVSLIITLTRVIK